MNDIKLSQEQKEFAEEHHNLIYAFLNNKKLPENDYYDIVVFGFLRAVKEYSQKPELGRYSFTTIAWRNMNQNLSNYFRDQNRQKRHGYTLSLDSILDNSEFLLDEKTASVHDSLIMQLETELLLHELASRVSRRQMSVIRMKAYGYDIREIAREQKTTMKDIRKLLDSTYHIVLSVCTR